MRKRRAAAYIPSIVLERPVYLRETADGLFKPVIYLTHKILEETVLSVAMALVFSMLVYIVVDLAVSRRSFSGFSPFYVTMLLLERRKRHNVNPRVSASLSDLTSLLS